MNKKNDFDKKNNYAFKKSLVIGIKGFEKNVGATHLAIMLAFALSKGGNKVALIEHANSQTFQEIESAYEGAGFKTYETQQFSIKYVTFFKKMSEQNFGLAFHGNFEYIIIDQGGNGNFEKQFESADYKIVLGYASPWKMTSYLQNMTRYRDKAYAEGVIYCVQWMGDSEKKHLEKVCKQKITQIPNQTDPFLVTEQSIQLAKQIILRK